MKMVDVKEGNHYYSAYLGQAKMEYRKKAYSGGIIQILMEAVLEQGGLICAPVWQEGSNIRYKCTRDLQDIVRIKFPLLVWAPINDILEDVNQYLLKGKKILFIGVPCQTIKMKEIFLQAEGLILVELVCGGMTTAKVFEKYMDNFEKKVEDVSFMEDKRYFFYDTNMNIRFEDGSYFRQDRRKNRFILSISEGFSVTDNCVECSLKMNSGVADITLGDMLELSQWGAVGTHSDLNDKLGTNYIITNTEAGMNLLNICRSGLEKLDILEEEHVNALQALVPVHKGIMRRERFLKLLNLKSYNFDKAFDYTKEEKYDVAINGDWSDYNYGAVITAAALSWTLEKMGYSSILVQYGIRPFYNPKVLFSVTGDRIWETVTVSKNYKNAVDCEELSSKCDIYLLGSDVNWRSDYMFTGTYLGEYMQPGKKKISYSTSFGEDWYRGTRCEQARAKSYIGDFIGIGVREDDGVNICKDSFDIDAVHVLDPVMICDEVHYAELTKDIVLDLPEKYLFYYEVQEDPMGERRQCVEKVASMLQLPIVTVKSYNLDLGDGRNYYRIEEFLKCFMNATYFMGDSFHGTCFAILFHIPFTVFVNPIKGATRIYSLTRDFDLESRVVNGYSADELEKATIDYDVNWKRVDLKLQKRREFSLNWLRGKLEESRETSDDVIGDWIYRLSKRIKVLEMKDASQKRDRIKEFLKNHIHSNSSVMIRGAGTETKTLIPIIEEAFTEQMIHLEGVVDMNTESSIEYKGQLLYAISDENKDVYRDIAQIIVVSGRHHYVIVEQLISAGIEKERILDLSEYIICNNLM